MSGYEVFIAVINTTVVGTPPRKTANTPTITPRSVAAAATGRGQRKNIVFTAYMGGCVLVEAGSFLVSGSDFSHCNARFVGGGMSLLAVTTVVQDSTFSNNFGDMVRGRVDVDISDPGRLHISVLCFITVLSSHYYSAWMPYPHFPAYKPVWCSETTQEL